MNLAQLQYFVKLAELQHFTRTAEQLYITQPTLSNAIAKLETELGVMLFVREGRKVSMTKHGRDFLRYASLALEGLEQGKALAREQAGDLTGTVDVGTIFTIQDEYLPMIICKYREKYGDGPVINVFQGLTSTLIQDLENERYDVVFSAYAPDHERLEYIKVLSQNLAVVVHPSHPFAKKKEVLLADLHGHHLITYRYNSPLGKEVQALLEEERLVPTEQYDDEITLASMTNANPDAVAIALDTLGFAPFSNLVALPIGDVPKDFHPVYLVFKKGIFLTPAVRNFITLVRQESSQSSQS